MFIQQMHLANFKRFTDLKIDLSKCPLPPRLVLLVGANGSGKSSIFDLFEWLSRHQKEGNLSEEVNYYRKRHDLPVESTLVFANGEQIHRKEDQILQDIQNRHLFYGRSAFRHVPRLTRRRLSGNFNIETDSDRPRLLIEQDQRLENDLEIFNIKILEEIFNGGEFDSRLLRQRYLTPINRALQAIFGDDNTTSLELTAIIPPGDGKIANFRFRKGMSELHYDLLSSGEKEVVNVLLNLLVRIPHYRNTIYLIDELDVHLNTDLQYTLLKEVVENWLPENCQLWTATHSLGFIQYARESTQAATLDFDQFDFDQPRTLLPQSKEILDIYEEVVR